LSPDDAASASKMESSDDEDDYMDPSAEMKQLEILKSASKNNLI